MPTFALRCGDTVRVPGSGDEAEYHFRIVCTITSQGACDVFLVEDSRHGLTALKILKPDRSRQLHRVAEEWERESRIHKHLINDNVVNFVNSDARNLSITMAYFPASTTDKDWRDSNNIFRGTLEDSIRIINDTVNGLHYIHASGFEHRDIKPGNVLSNRGRGAVICDFGLARAQGCEDHRGGTPFYLPPEYLVQQKRGTLADVFALAGTHLYILRLISLPALRPNWRIAKLHDPMEDAGLKMKEWLQEVNQVRSRLNPDDTYQATVQKMLDPDPDVRLTMKQVIELLQPRLGNHSTLQQPVGIAGMVLYRRGSYHVHSLKR